MKADELFVHKEIEKAGGLSQIDKAIELIQKYRLGEYYESKNRRLAQWRPDEKELYNLIVAVFTTTLTTDYLTYQALIGRHRDKMPHENSLDRAKTIAEVIALIHHAGLIYIKANLSDYFIIVPCFMLEGIPFTDRHGTVYDRPQPVESNYDPEQGSMLLGGKLNHHEDNICLDHINRMNKIPLALNKEFLLKYPEEPKDNYIKEHDTEYDIVRKEELWSIYERDCKHRYADMLVRINRCYLNHKPDTRGRTYSVGYYINYQGSSYKKASLQLADKELLNDKIAFPKP